MNKKRQILALKTLVWLVGLTPVGWLSWRAFQGSLGANPIEELMHRLGGAALILLITTLAVTPLRRITGWNPIIQIRRPLGLFGFFYVTLHFLVYSVLDQTLDWEFILEDLTERRYIVVGFSAWLLLIPLALTSTKGWIRRLGKKWRKLHRLAYVATALGVLHFYWQVKADTYWPLVATAVLVVLMVIRLPLPKGRSRGGPGGSDRMMSLPSTADE